MKQLAKFEREICIRPVTLVAAKVKFCFKMYYYYFATKQNIGLKF